ncbi:hypothetical protein A2U01_0073395, partial [Trifolium medium]|nr:hypothetical protein [Trifolium medium]
MRSTCLSCCDGDLSRMPRHVLTWTGRPYLIGSCPIIRAGLYSCQLLAQSRTGAPKSLFL